MWKLHNDYLPNSITKNFHRNTRAIFSRSLFRLETLKQFVLFVGPEHWSHLPSDISSKPNLNSFTIAYKKHLGYSPITNNRMNRNTDTNSNNSNIPVLRRGRNNYGRLANWTGDRMVR